MVSLTFEWRNSSGNNCLMIVTSFNEKRAWNKALKKCKWENRTSLKTVNSRGYTLTNWFEACNLGFIQ